MTKSATASASLPKDSASRSEDLREIAKLLEAQTRRRERTKLHRYRAYTKQHKFHADGLIRERLLIAGNQVGKTYCGGAEAAFHATGEYPDWWPGRRWNRPTRGWAGSKTGEVTRDGVQRTLLGEPKDKNQWGTGLIPGDKVVDWSLRQGLADACDSILVKHVSGGISTIGFKSYDQGREKWQSETLDWTWLDEEPPQDIYTEALTRTNATGGMAYLTFTPLLGMSDVVHMFLDECGLDGRTASRAVTQMTIDDAEHYTPSQRAAIIASYPAHEREARINGIPSLGSGRVFPVPEDSILCDPVPIPKHWPQIIGLDFGWDHPFAAACLAWDRDADVLYVTKTYRQRESTPVIHAASVKPWGKWIPCAWPHDGYQHDKGSGDQLATLYRNEGLNTLLVHATHEDGGNGVEAGIMEMLDRMQTDRFKVFRQLNDWMGEFRLYHRQDGKIVKERDDLLSATRYAMMMKRFAETAPGPKLSIVVGGRSRGGWMGQ